MHPKTLVHQNVRLKETLSYNDSISCEIVKKHRFFLAGKSYTEICGKRVPPQGSLFMESDGTERGCSDAGIPSLKDFLLLRYCLFVYKSQKLGSEAS